MKKLALTDLILTLREELQQAQEKAKGQKIAFEIQDIELEVQIVAEEDKGASFGAKLFALDFGVKGEQKDIATHKLKLKLKPTTQEPGKPAGPVTVSNQRSIG